MLRIASAFALLLISMSTVSASQTIQVPMICVDKSEMVETLGEFNELPMMTMRTIRDLDGRPFETKTILFVNPKTRTWTIVEQIGDAFCALSAGSSAAPYID